MAGSEMMIGGSNPLTLTVILFAVDSAEKST